MLRKDLFLYLPVLFKNAVLLVRIIARHKVSIVHGKMKAIDKDYEMQEFAKGNTQITECDTNNGGHRQEVPTDPATRPPRNKHRTYESDYHHDRKSIRCPRKHIKHHHRTKHQ
mgnify:CR=1 FL=1